MKIISILCCLLSTNALAAQDTLSYPLLVHRLYDLIYLANPPLIGEKSGNVSSYDRRSKYDTISNSYIKWSANSDGSGYIRKEGNDIVIFDKDGPGVIWRFWSALAKDGHIKIFIDNSETPVMDKPFRDFFETFENDIPPMNFPNIVMTLSRGRNSYLPIPFNKHCKILLSENWGAYYQISYTKFPEQTQVISSSGNMSREDCFALANADRLLSTRGYLKPRDPEEKTDIEKLIIKPGGKMLVKKLTGNKAITDLRFFYDELTKSTDDNDFLSNLWISITWDSEKVPAILSPIGMFFGTGKATHPYRALPIGVLSNELYSAWFMPFSEKATVEVINNSNKKIETKCSITYKELNQSSKELLRFHAQWHDGSPYKKKTVISKGNDFILKDFEDDKSALPAGRDIDWTLLKVRGLGRFCGLTLHVENTWKEPDKKEDTWWYGKWNKKSIDWWWGEGDEKFFVDGEKFPSTFGTGSEDYIGFAWSAEPPFPTFDSPFACQPFTPLNGNGTTIVNRFHIADNIPFQESFEAYLEKYKKDKWGSDNTCLYDVVVYWYQESTR